MRTIDRAIARNARTMAGSLLLPGLSSTGWPEVREARGERREAAAGDGRRQTPRRRRGNFALDWLTFGRSRIKEHRRSSAHAGIRVIRNGIRPSMWPHKSVLP